MITSIKKKYNNSPHMGRMIEMAKNIEPPKELRDHMRLQSSQLSISSVKKCQSISSPVKAGLMMTPGSQMPGYY